jgi:hypothetical protein
MSDEATANKQEVKGGGQSRKGRKKKEVGAPKMGVPFYSWRVEAGANLVPSKTLNPKPDSTKIKN